jgi:hypothetical protein
VELREQRPPATSDFEQAIGSRWLAWAGALIVVAGIGLFVKYAYDQGWIRVPPAWRCVAGAAFGFALLGVGETLRRKVNAIAAAGVLAAGVGSIYASVLAAHELYRLIPPGVTLVLLGITSMIGVVAAMRSRLVSVGAVSLIGGYLAPILVTGQTLSTVVLPSYLLFLLSVGVVLAGSRGGAYGWLRFITWWGTFALGSLWMAGTGLTHATSSIPFLAVAWLLVHGELGWSTVRGFLRREDGKEFWKPFHQDWRWWRPLLSSFGMTAWVTGLAILLAKRERPDLDWLGPASVASACSLALSVLLLAARRRRMKSDVKNFAVCLGAEAGGLILLTIGMALTGWVMAIGWLMLGLASVCAATVIRSRPMLVYGLVALIVGSGRLLLYDWAFSGMNTGGREFVGLHLTTWTGMMSIAAASWLAAGLMTRKRMGAEMRPVGMASIAIATGLGPAAFLNTDAAAGAMSAIMLASGLICTALYRGTKSIVFLAAAPSFMLLGLAFAFGTMWWQAGPGKFAGIDGLPLRARALSAVFAGLALIVSGRILPRNGETEDVRDLLGIVGTLMFYAALAHNESRAYAMCWGWMVLSAGVGLAGLVSRGPLILSTAIGGLVGAGAAWVVAYLAPGWTTSHSPALLHPGLWASMVISGMAIVLSGLLGTRLKPETRGSVVPAIGAACGLMLMASTTLELARIAAMASHDAAARGGAVSIWWAMVASGMIAGGFARRVPLVRHAGLALLFIVGGKIVLLDLHEVAPAWRIASFLSVGVLMLLVAVGYARLSAIVTRSRRIAA